MTRIEPDRFVDLFLGGRAVQTGRPTRAQVPDLSVSQRLSRDEQLRIHAREEPLEVLAAEGGAEGKPGRDVSKVTLSLITINN